MNPNRQEPLDIAMSLFNSFEKQNIEYCHWKSNQHLGAALIGDTDIDLLVSRYQSSKCEQILLDFNYKRVISPSFLSYPGIEDWVGFDSKTGRLVHVHLHYQLITGRKGLKEQHLPWEAYVLKNRIVDKSYDVYINNPNIEILLLFIRIALKTNKLHYKFIMKKNFIPDNILDEVNYLFCHTDKVEVLKHANVLFGDENGTRIVNIIYEKWHKSKSSAIKDIKTFNKMAISRYRRISSMDSIVVRLVYYTKVSYSIGKYKLSSVKQLKKKLANSGLIVAFIGSDGSGKTTVTKEIYEWLTWKIDAERIYFGSGKEPKNIILKMLYKTKQKISSKKSAITNKKLKRSEGSLIMEGIKSFYKLLIADDRFIKVIHARKSKIKGCIILGDRYPQSNIRGVFDGPSIDNYIGNKLIGYLSRIELYKYNEMDLFPPDIVFRLNVDSETAIKRKPDHNKNVIEHKVEVFNTLEFENSRIYDIDASDKLENVVLKIKQVIWDNI